MQWSTWSTTIAYSVSGIQLASNIAGGWPLPMGHRLVMPSGGRRGSLAEGQDDVPGTTVDTCSASVPVLMPYFSSFYVKVNSDPEVVFLALWRVGVHAEWRSAHSRSFSFPCSHLEFGHYVMSPSYLAVLVRCLGVLSWRNAWSDYGYMFCVSRSHGAFLGLVVDMPVGVKTTGLWSDSGENCGFRSCIPLTSGRCPRCASRADSQVQVWRRQSSPTVAACRENR